MFYSWSIPSLTVPTALTGEPGNLTKWRRESKGISPALLTDGLLTGNRLFLPLRVRALVLRIVRGRADPSVTVTTPAVDVTQTLDALSHLATAPSTTSSSSISGNVGHFVVGEFVRSTVGVDPGARECRRQPWDQYRGRTGGRTKSFLVGNIDASNTGHASVPSITLTGLETGISLVDEESLATSNDDLAILGERLMLLRTFMACSMPLSGGR